VPLAHDLVTGLKAEEGVVFPGEDFLSKFDQVAATHRGSGGQIRANQQGNRSSLGASAILAHEDEVAGEGLGSVVTYVNHILQSELVNTFETPANGVY
jgi:hypothetical protein